MGSPRARRLLVRGGVALLVLAASAAAGVYAAAAFAPERLRVELERRIEDATGGPCEIARLRLVPGLPIEIEGRGIALWDGALRVDAAVARVSVLSALLGRVRLARLEVEGAWMPLHLVGDGPVLPWEAPREDAAADDTAGTSAPAALEGALRALLGPPLVADALRVREARVPVRWSDGERSVDFEVEVEGRLSHSRLRGLTELEARTRIVADGAPQGLLEWRGRGERGEPLRLTAAATELDLPWLARAAGVRAVRVRGVLSGVADYRVSDAGRSSVDVDAVARDFGLVDPATAEYVVSSPHVAAELRVAADAEHFEVSGARLESGDLAFGLDAVLARPVDPEAALGLTLRLADVDLERARELVAALPDPVRERARAIASALTGGRIVSLEARGGARLRDWRDTFTGHTQALPNNLALEIRVADLGIGLGERDRIEGVSGALVWQGDALEIRDAKGRRAGVPLPALDLELHGISHLFAADLGERVEPSQEILLPGMSLLLSTLGDTGEGQGPPPRIELWVERLEHPALLWPVRALEMDVHGEDDALVARVRRLQWAGVPFRGEITWTPDPERLRARFEATAQREPAHAEPVAPPRMDPGAAPGPSAEPTGRVWGAGRFEVGPMETRVWRHAWLRGRFDATGSRVRFEELEARLAPRGHLAGHGHLDLGAADALPYGAEFVVEDVEAGALLAQAGLGEDIVTGRVDLRGRLEDRYVPETPPFSRLSGRLDIDARDGVIEQTLPAVLALTLASDRLDFTGERENIRYTQASASLELTDGVVSTDAFTLDGPDVRVFGSGTLDLARPPHRIDAELAVFLFRPVDWAIGAIPVLNTLLLGESKNLVAAHFELVGPWDAPVADAKPLRTLSRGSIEVMKGIPRVMQRGIEMLGGLGEVLGTEPAPSGGDGTGDGSAAPPAPSGGSPGPAPDAPGDDAEPRP